LNIRILEDMNEYTTHILETVKVHMVLDKAHQTSAGESVPGAHSGPDGIRASRNEGCINSIQTEVLSLIHKCPLQDEKSVCEVQTQLCGLSA
jgi:replication factor A4